MYQSKMRFVNKVLAASATLAIASLLTTVPASGCAVSAGAKPKSGAALSPGAGAMALSLENAPLNSKSKTTSFVGLWDIKIYSQGQFFDEGFDAFHNDSTEILITQDNPITENVCLGVWEQTGPSTIKVKHPSWYFDTNGNLLGTVIIYETLTLDCDDSFHGNSSEDLYDTQGNKIAHYDGFEIKAKRITP
jgi:hypothetical protein